MQPEKLREILAVVNKKLNEASPKGVEMGAHVMRKLNFEALKARAQHEAEAKGLAGALEKCEMLGKPAARVITRQNQLALSAGKKGKQVEKPAAEPEKKPTNPDEEPNENPDEDLHDVGDRKPKPLAKVRAKAKAKATGKAKASDDIAGYEEPTDDWDWTEDTEAKEPPRAAKKKIKRKLSRSVSKGSFKKLRKMKKMKTARAEDFEEDATAYYGEGFIAGAVDRAVPPRTSKGKRKSKAAEDPDEEPAEEAEAAEEPAEEDEADVATFARRYPPKRAYYRAKFFAFRDTYNDRMRVFLTNHSKMEDVWWKFVAQTMEEAPEDEHGWREPVQKMAYDFLVDDDFSPPGCHLAGDAAPTLKTLSRQSQAFILVVLCLLFNERLTKASDKDFFFLEHYAGEAVMSQEIEDSPCGKGYSAAAGTILVSVLCVALGANWVLEQPGLRLPFLDDAVWIYTRPFSQEMAKLLPFFMKSSPMRPTGMVDASTIEKLRCLDMGEDDWADGGLWDLLRYVYGAKGLCIPAQWKELESAIAVAVADVKTEPGTESQVAQVQLTPELLQKLGLLQFMMVSQQNELNKLRESQKQEPQNAKPQQQEPMPEAAQPQLQSPSAGVVKLSSPRGSKRVCPESPVKNNKASTAPSEVPNDDSSELEVPKVLKSETLDKLEKEKIKRIVTPKKGSGNLEVPEDIFDMWRDAANGRQKIFQMWAKSGGVKGGFYSKEDMKVELGSRIDKIVAWAEKKKLVRTCEYDDETLEYWVNTRTLGTMTKEDFEMMQRERKYEGEGGDELVFKPDVHLDKFDFSDDDRMIHKNEANLEGDHRKSASQMMSMMTGCFAPQVASRLKEYLKQVLKSKNSLETFVDKVKEIETLYEEMGELKAEAKADADEGTQGSYVTPVISEQMLDIYPWTDSEDDATAQSQNSDIDMDVSGTSWASALTREPPSPSSAASSLDLDQRLLSETTVASKILWHCVQVINAVRKDNGGFALCVFKIGLTANPFQRRANYLEQNFQNFIVIHKVCRAELLGMLEMLEAALIAEFYDDGRCCRNRQLGGESMRTKDFLPRFQPPYYAYCVPAKDLVVDAKAAVKRDPCEDELQLGINLAGSSGATRFFFTVISNLVAKTDDKIFDDVMEIWSQQLKALQDDGFEMGGKTWRIMILGFTGDSPFVKKVAKTTRSFHNVRKRHTSKNVQKGCCWLCNAGHDSPEDGIFYPFEHLGFTAPAWLQTCRLNNPLPWDGNGCALLQHMLLDKDDTPAAFFKADYFHVWHAGVGQDFCASAMVYCMKALFGRGSVSKDVSALNDALKAWLPLAKQKLQCGRITEDLLGYNGTREYPEGKWSKNMDTAVFTKFIVHLLERPDFQPKLEHDDILQDILAAGKAIGQVIRTCLEAEFFLSSAHCQTVIKNGHASLMTYSTLVEKCYDRSLCLFKMRPKVHYLNHTFLRVFEEWRDSSSACNPLAEATFMSEDFVGRAARLSRRISPRAIAIKTLQRYLLFLQTSLSKDTFAMLDLSMLT
ncbi:hypothetical protein AK812_SmicGene10912 [Symbiodinium microadriaticum]|uniref:Uncharacterized protein n=1 Tax=Symbiodinium microadriaticum TaxID=2951 RepID=A0A1Q9EEI6_SYMMI|nr:hypothetical protein AK812_SmicGene10912 [Symbiodinium microadriaticum]